MNIITRNVFTFVITYFILIFLSSCSDNKPPTPIYGDNLQIEKSAVIPVLDGQSITAGVYIRNNSGTPVSDINYALKDANMPSKVVIDKFACRNIPAHSSCLLPITTPSLSLSVAGQGSDIIVATYGTRTTEQLISYQYVKSSAFNGVNFSNNSAQLNGTNDYVTVYAFVGNGKSQNQVAFNLSNNSIAISHGLTNGVVDIPVGAVVPLEIQSNNNVTNHLVTVTPYIAVKNKNSSLDLNNNQIDNNQLQVTILSPEQRANLNMGLVPLLTPTESIATLSIYNSGNLSASAINITNDSTITVTSSNCSTSLAAGASCSYTVRLNSNTYSNGSAQINLSYNDSTHVVNTAATVYYVVNYAVPMITTLPTQSTLTESINVSQNVTYNIANLGGAPLNNIVVTPRKSGLANTTVSVATNTCGSTLAANATCQIQLQVAASYAAESGKVYFSLSGNLATTNYTFMSVPTNVTIIDTTTPVVTSTTPQNLDTSVSLSTAVIVNFSKPMNPTTLNNTTIFLQRNSDHINVPLTSQGVSNNNQTITFTQTSGQLLSESNYSIIVNPSVIYDSNGNVLGNSTSQTVATFRTVDVTAPTVVSVTPVNGATNQTRSPAITIGFSEPMNTATLTSSNIILQTQAGAVVSGYTISYDSSTYTATLNLQGTLLNSQTTYQLIINQANIKDLAGNAIGTGNNTLSTFTIGDYTAPVLSSTVPINGATNVAVGSSISLTFSESMNPATLTNNTIHLQRNITASNVSLTTGVISNNNQTVTFSPVNELAGGESYSIIINPSTITDAAGNSVGSATAQVVSTFTSVTIAQKALLVGYNGQVLSFDSSNNSFTVLSEMKPNYLSVIAGNNGLVEVGENGRINFSFDGKSWIRESSGTIYTINKVIWDGSQYIAVGGSFVLTSSDGERWMVRNINSLYSPNVVNLMGIAYNSGNTTYKYVAVGQYGQVIFSNDLITWSHNDTLVSKNIAFFGIVAGTTSSGIFMTYSTSRFFSTSAPLSGWTEDYTFSFCPIGTNLAMNFNSNYGEFILTKMGGNACYSNIEGTTRGTSSTVFNMYSVSGGGYTYNIATGEGVVTSSTNYGGTWSTTINLPYNSNPLYGGAAVNGGGVYVVAGNNGINYWNSVNPTVAANWNSVVPSDPRLTVYAVAGNESAGSKTYIAVGGEYNYGAIYKSTNVGVSWSNVIPAAVSTNIFKGITYANSMFVAVGQSGKIITSATGESGAWVVRTSSTTNNLNGITYCKGKFIAVGDSGTILTSIDGITWSIPSGTGTTTFNGVACGTDKIVAVGRSGTIYYSTDGTTWTSATSGTTNNLTAVTYGNKHFVVTEATTGLALSGAYLTSADGVTWTTRSITGAGYYWNYYAIQYVGGKFIAFGNLGNGNTINYLSPTLGVVAISQDNSESSGWSIIGSYESAALTTTYGGVAY